MSATKMQNCHEHLVDLIQRDIETMFKPEFRSDYAITILCRHKRVDTMDIMVSNDTQEGLLIGIERAFSAKAVELK